MNKEFIPYEQALALKELGFDEPCFGYYSIDSLNLKTPTFNMGKPFEYKWCLPAPLYQQAFRFFREKYGLCLVIKLIHDKRFDLGYNLLKNGLIMRAYTTYEKAEHACLIKLIELSTKTA
jgi:hypothetical protein